MSPDLAIEDEAPVRVARLYCKLPASDVGRARTFYSEKLGLQPFAEIHNHLYYQVAGVNFVIFPSAGSPSGTHDQLGFVVLDLDAEVARLRARGVVFESYPPPPGAVVTGEITDLGAVRASWFKDSEGNLISIAEFRSGPFAS